MILTTLQFRPVLLSQYVGAVEWAHNILLVPRPRVQHFSVSYTIDATLQIILLTRIRQGPIQMEDQSCPQQHIANNYISFSYMFDIRQIQDSLHATLSSLPNVYEYSILHCVLWLLLLY